ncbi:MAG: flavin reductase family protein [Bacteroidota bacterium]
MLVVDPKSTPTGDLHQFLLGAVAPRPIAFASTIDEEGNPNLAPYSFFNCFSSNPPTLVFSSNRRVSDNTTKDTLHNIEATGEVVVNVVSHAIVRQMAVTSISFDTGVSEFSKSGLTPVASDLVKPFRVKESPVQMECKVKDIITLGDQGGAGHLIICEVVRMHVNEAVLDENNRIDPNKIDLVGRMGRAFYARASGDAVFTVVQPVTTISIGFEQLPDSIRESEVLTGNNLGILAGLSALPDKDDIVAIMDDDRVKSRLAAYPQQHQDLVNNLHTIAKAALDEGDLGFGSLVAFLPEYL